MLKVDLLKKNETNMVATRMKIYYEEMAYKDSCKLKRLKCVFFFNCEYRYVILSRGM